MLVDDKDGMSRFFKETFLSANINMGIAYRMSSLTLNNIKINFNNQKLSWRLYTPVEALLIIRQVELIEKNEFTIAALDPDNEIFIIHVVFITSLDPMHLSY